MNLASARRPDRVGGPPGAQGGARTLALETKTRDFGGQRPLDCSGDNKDRQALQNPSDL